MQHRGTLFFQTERLVFRRFHSADYEDMFRNWAANPNVQLEYGEPVYEDIQQVKELLNTYMENYQKPDYYRWAIIERKSNRNIGQIALCRVYSAIKTAEIEYCIGESFWGNGFAAEALNGLIEFLFRNTEFEKLEAYHRSENVRSGRVLEKSRMHRTETVERFRQENKTPEGEVCYCIECGEYFSNNKNKM